MRVVSWNMNHANNSGSHEAAWAFLLSLEPDIALVQEAVVPEDVPYTSIWEPGWDHLPWGTAILSRVGALEVSWRDHLRGAVIAARCDLPGIGEATVASVHARIVDRRVVPALRETFEEIRRNLRERFIVGGDLNTARAAGIAWPQNGHTEFWSDVEAWGFQDCYYVLH
ncbi:MAG: endonuclease/exonuclease/phosphatase family protein, partial [Actinomycetota bacterium]|nr:endonuclease/exonuclease/phosphatase family protein [Actinomycetota bacterium]